MATGINATSHKFTSRQEKHLRNIFKISRTKDISDEDYDLFMQLSNMDGTEDRIVLANKLCDIISKYDFAVMPIGSPLFMANFITIYTRRDIKTILLFSIMEKRIVETKRGKTAQYRFIKFEPL